jgi:hypothetical protein
MVYDFLLTAGYSFVLISTMQQANAWVSSGEVLSNVIMKVIYPSGVFPRVPSGNN